MIAIVAPFNPSSVARFFDEDVINTNVTASSVNNIVNSFVEHGHQVCVFTTSPLVKRNLVIVYNSARLKVYVLGIRSWNKLFTVYPRLEPISKAISSLIKIEIHNISLIHCHWTYEFAYACFPFVNIVPVYCTVRDWAPNILKLIPLDLSPLNALNKLYWIYKKRIQREVLTNKHIRFVANSHYTKSLISQIVNGNDVFVIPNSIDNSLIRKYGSGSETFSNVFVSIAASLDVKHKNVLTLIKAFDLYHRKYNNAILRLIGSYHKNKRVYQYVKKHNLLSVVSFLGKLDNKDVIKVIEESSCLVHPSIEETFGNILLEAMARKIPIIGGSSSGAVPEILGYGKYGFLCDVSNPYAICAEMEKVAKFENLDYLTDEAINRLRNIYSADAVYDAYRKLYSI